MRKQWRVQVACLLAGFVLNVLAAMACARWGSEMASPFARTMHDAIIEPETLPLEAVVFLSDAGYQSSLPSGRPTRFKKTWWATWLVTRTMYSRYERGAGWDLDHVDPDKFYEVRVHGVHAFGFPMRSMRYVHHEDVEAVIRGQAEPQYRVPGWRGGWPLEPTGNVRLSQFITTTIAAPERPLGVSRIVAPASVAYPLVPMPLGFVVNSLLYAAVVFGLCLMPGTVRRWLRRRRHQCESCGYPRPIGDAVARGASLVCSECGEAHA